MGDVSRLILLSNNYRNSNADPASDIADAFPAATVTGVDLSPIQPNWVPPNCMFEVDDVTLPSTYCHESFDFIHIREMFGSVGDWDELFSQAYKALKPGGFLECAEHSVTPVSDDDTVGPDHVFTRYGTIMTDLSRKRGKEADVWIKLKERMKRAGFVDVVETRTKWPMNGWSSDPKMRELGRWNRLRITQGIEGFAMRMLTTFGGVCLKSMRLGVETDLRFI
jgi:SAM-dependent methyltransferase